MKKGILSIIIFIIVILTMVTISFAESYNLKINLKDATSADIEQGKTVTFLIKLTDIDVENGIGAISGKFEYDTNVFEKIKAADIKASSGWGNVTYNDQNEREGEFVTERSAGDFVKDPNDLMEIEATVKLNAPTGRTEIKISKIMASGGEDVEISDVTAGISIVGDNPPVYNNTTNNTTNTNNTNNIANNNTNTANNNANGTSNNSTLNNTTVNDITTNNVTSGESIPKTGIEDYTMPFILILLAIAIVSYIRYKKMNNII